MLFSSAEKGNLLLLLTFRQNKDYLKILAHMATINNGQIENNIHLASLDDHVLFIHIAQWENHSIAKIHTAAEQARNDLKQMFDEKRRDYNYLLSQINKEVKINSSLDANLSHWTGQLNKLVQDLLSISTCIHLKHDENELPIRLIKLHHKHKVQIKKIDQNAVISCCHLVLNI